MSKKYSTKETTRIQAQNTVKPRNYLALNPLLQKGGIHESDDVAIARKRARRSCKQNLRKVDWFDELADDYSIYDDEYSATNTNVDYVQLELDKL